MVGYWVGGPLRSSPKCFRRVGKHLSAALRAPIGAESEVPENGGWRGVWNCRRDRRGQGQEY